MVRYIAVDSGKMFTKVAVFSLENTTDLLKNEVKKFSFKTKFSAGDFADDAIEGGTFICDVGGTVYKLGNGAKNEAPLHTSKKSEIHKICTLAAIAMNTSSKEVDDVYVVIGMPVDEFALMDKRQEYKDYILPDGTVEVKLKKSSEGEILTKKFNIVGKYVYPESAGALYFDPIRYEGKSVGVIDIGNLNINNTIWDNFDYDSNFSFTDELGGNILLTGLSQELSSRFGRVKENYVLKVLLQEKRCLIPNNGNKKVQEESAKVIDQYLIKFVEEIRRKCDAKQWSLDFIPLVFIGGTAGLLAKEIKQVFGENVVIHENPEYVNVLGFLQRLCGYKLEINLPKRTNKKEKVA